MTIDNNGGRLFLRSVRIDNYKCFSDFEMSFGDLTLLLGKNGCGKTTVFDAVSALSLFVRRSVNISELFPTSTLSRWDDNDNKQSFELRVARGDGGGEFCYRLTVDHHRDKQIMRVASETLTLDGNPLFEFVEGEVQLYRDNKSKGPKFSYNWEVSGIPNISDRGDNKQLCQFRDWLDNITPLSLVPEKMDSGTDSEAQYPNADGSNFASWYRWMMLEDSTVMSAADEALSRVLTGYRRMKLAKVGGKNYRELQAVFASDNGKESDYAFDELSSGQRILIVLYCILHGGGRERVLLLDEPDNFVTLPEVQPLFAELEMDAGGDLPQVALISHHPQAMDFFSTRDMVWMKRDAEQPARIVKFENKTGLHTSQLCAQGGTP